MSWGSVEELEIAGLRVVGRNSFPACSSQCSIRWVIGRLCERLHKLIAGRCSILLLDFTYRFFSLAKGSPNQPPSPFLIAKHRSTFHKTCHTCSVNLLETKEWRALLLSHVSEPLTYALLGSCRIIEALSRPYLRHPPQFGFVMHI